MTKIQKALVIVAVIILFIAVGVFIFTLHSEKEEKKYDVSLMIVRYEIIKTEQQTTAERLTEERWYVSGDSYSFDIDQDYDGKKYIYEVYAYQFSNHTEVGDVWFRKLGSGGMEIRLGKFESVNQDENGENHYTSWKGISERGEYFMKINVSESAISNGKTVNLKVTIK